MTNGQLAGTVSSQAADQGYVQICKRSRLLRFSQSSLPRIPSDLRERKTIKPLATIHFAKQATKKRIGRFGIVSGGFEPQNQPVFVPGTKMKLRARGFEIVCEFVPGFVPNAYARTRGGIRRQGGQNDNQTRPNQNGATTNERERVGVAGNRQRNTNQQVEAPHVPVRGFFAKFGARMVQRDELNCAPKLGLDKS